MNDALQRLLDPAQTRGRASALAARSALAQSGLAIGRWFAAPLIGRTEAAIELAPLAAFESLADRALDTGRGLERPNAWLPDPAGGGSTLAQALGHACHRGLADPAELAAALQARREERHLGHHTDRRAFAEHQIRRAAPLPMATLRLMGGETERRRVLVEKAIVAAAVARGLCRFDAELAAGRLPLTSEDLERQRVAPTDLRRTPATEALRKAVAEQVVWGRELLAVAWALPHDLGPRHAPWAGGWLRRVEARLRGVEATAFDLTGQAAEPTPAALERATLVGALWWLPPRSVVDHGGR